MGGYGAILFFDVEVGKTYFVPTRRRAQKKDGAMARAYLLTNLVKKDHLKCQHCRQPPEINLEQGHSPDCFQHSKRDYQSCHPLNHEEHRLYHKSLHAQADEPVGGLVERLIQSGHA